MRLVIYGAQGYALGAYEAIKELNPPRPVMCFLVSSMGSNAPTLGGLPVREIADFSAGMSQDDKDQTQVLIATPENVQPEIEKTLEEYGFKNHSCLTSERYSELVKLYHTRKGDFLSLKALPVGTDKPSVSIYMAKSHKDKPLKKPAQLPDYVHPIQVGAANTEERIADIMDNTGENISERNVNYSELTGLYWVWKHALDSEAYVGLMQYRRMLTFSEDDLLRLSDNDVDVVLPYPMPYEPNIHAHHERYLKEVDWNALLTALKELQPEYAETFPKVLEQQYLYNYNVILAKNAVLREYCEWLFPVLDRTEELSVPKGSDRADRYIGYMGETLETLYFMKNVDRLHMVHARCDLLV